MSSVAPLLNMAAAPSPASPPPAVEVEGVWAAYGPHAFALRDVSLRVGQGERRAVVGPSGSGKSTLLRLLKGLIPAARGEARVLGEAVRAHRGGRRDGERIGYIPQNLGLVDGASVLDNALMGALHRTGGVRSWLGVYAAGEYEGAMEALEAVGIAGLAARNAHQLSGGERRRLAVARALVQRPRILLADEFLSELDGATAQQVLGALDAACARAGMTALIVEHNLRVACDFCDRVTVLRDGAVVAEASGGEMNEYTLRCLFAAGTPA